MPAFAKLLPLAIVGTVASSLFAVACTSSTDGSGGGSGPGAVSDVDSSKAVNNLSDSEVKEYCEDGKRYSEAQLAGIDLKKIGCGISAQLLASYGAENDADAQAKCRTQFDECMKQPTENTGADAGAQEDDCAAFKEQVANCNATVGEVNQCVADQTAALKALSAKDFCAEAKAMSNDTPPNTTAFQPPASCKAIQSKCPSLAGTANTEDADGTDG